MKVVCKTLDLDEPTLEFENGINPKVGNIYNVIDCITANRFCKINGEIGRMIGAYYELAEIPDYYFATELFEKIQTNYASATSEILEKFKQTEETPDKILIPEKANA